MATGNHNFPDLPDEFISHDWSSSFQARDRWSNNIWGADFNVSAELFATTTSIDAAISASMGANETLTAVENNETPPESSSVTNLGNGSGIALVTYVPREAGTSLLYGEVTFRFGVVACFYKRGNVCEGCLFSGGPLHTSPDDRSWF